MMKDNECKLVYGYFVNIKKLVAVLEALPYTHMTCEALYDIIEELIQEAEIEIEEGDDIFKEENANEDSLWDPQGLFGGNNILKFEDHINDSTEGDDDE